MAGWIKDYRKEIESNIWLMPPMYHRVWQWIKYSVNHSEGKIPNKDGTFTDIKPGQRATSYRQIAKGVGYYEGRKWKEPNSKTIKSIIDWLAIQKMISVYSNTLGTIITVENWVSYQEKEEQGNSKRTTLPTRGKHYLDTNKNDKEELKNDKNKDSSSENNSDIEKLKFNNVDCIEYKLTKYLINYMKQNNEDVRVPSESTKQFDNWCIEFDRIIRIDKKDPEEIKDIIKFCQTDSFWMGNILSVSKLRKQYDQLILKKKNIGKNNYNQTTTERIKSSLENGALKKFLEDDGSNDDERLFCKTNS